MILNKSPSLSCTFLTTSTVKRFNQPCETCDPVSLKLPYSVLTHANIHERTLGRSNFYGNVALKDCNDPLIFGNTSISLWMAQNCVID